MTDTDNVRWPKARIAPFAVLMGSVPDPKPICFFCSVTDDDADLAGGGSKWICDGCVELHAIALAPSARDPINAGWPEVRRRRLRSVKNDRSAA